MSRIHTDPLPRVGAAPTGKPHLPKSLSAFEFDDEETTAEPKRLKLSAIGVLRPSVPRVVSDNER
jgi:hypothetical protein